MLLLVFFAYTLFSSKHKKSLATFSIHYSSHELSLKYTINACPLAFEVLRIDSVHVLSSDGPAQKRNCQKTR